MTMIVEERTYTLHPGKTRDFLMLVEVEGLPIQERYLGSPLAYFTTETGTLNGVVHLWQFCSMGDREEKRAQLAQDQQWIEFTAKVLPLIARMENRLLVPTRFSRIGNAQA